VRILLARLRPIGDVLFTTPIVAALRRRYPDARITYLVERESAPVLDGNPDIDELMVVQRSRGLARLGQDLALARTLARGRYDLAIDLHGGPRAAWLTWASRAPTRIGYRNPGRSWMYTTVVPRARGLVPRHSVTSQADLLAPLGIPPPAPEADPVRMPDRADVEARVTSWLAAQGVATAQRLIVVHVSASTRFKRWPESSFVDLLVGLAGADDRRRIAVSSGPSDVGAAGRIRAEAASRLGDRSTALLDVVVLPLPELRALVGRAALYVGGDSGPLHVAATTRVPIVELLGPTLAERSFPWRDPRHFAEIVEPGPLPCRPCHQRRCTPGDFRCLTGIGPARVLAAAERGLAAGADPPAASTSDPKARRIPMVRA
jgi:ADP-heptose:LPS heptosyltransferase